MLKRSAPELSEPSELGNFLFEQRSATSKGSSLGGELYRGVAWGEAALGQGVSFRLPNAFVPQPVTLGLPEDEAGNLVQTNRSEADLRWWYGLSGGRELEIGVQGSYFFTEDYAEMVPSTGGVVLDPDCHADYAQGLGFIDVQSPRANLARMHGLARYVPERPTVTRAR